MLVVVMVRRPELGVHIPVLANALAAGLATQTPIAAAEVAAMASILGVEHLIAP